MFSLTVTQLFQLYAPLAGLLLMAFWVGVLSQRVKTLEGDVAEMKTQGMTGGHGERLTRMETKMEHIEEHMERLGRGVEGVQRQLGNLMQRGGKIIDLGHLGAE